MLQVKRRALALAGRTGLLAALSIGLPAKVAAQGGSGRPIVLVITAYDELSAVVPDARLTLFSVEGVALASARSDAFGRWAIRLTTRDTSLSLSVRKIGFAPANQSFLVGSSDTIAIKVQLLHQPNELDTVRVTSRVLSNNYTLDADEIARSKRTILDAYDALRDLRPNMLGDRMRNCPFVQNLWVNGRPLPVFASEIVPMADGGQLTRDDGSGRRVLRSHAPVAHAPPDAPLALVKPQFISEMRYVNCNATPRAGTRSVNALFIDLKPGIGFDLKRGTYVADTAIARAARVVP